MITLAGDITRLNETMTVYASQLNLDSSAVVKTQAGILSRELCDASAPRSQSALQRNMDRDINRVYAPSPRKMLPVAHRQGHGFVWIMATKKAIIGVKPEDYRLEDTAQDMEKAFHKIKERGNKYTRIGWRGKHPDGQSVLQLNRTVVKRGVFEAFRRNLKNRAGILGGSWVVAWNILQPKGRKPAGYKFRHVASGTAKGTYIDGLGIKGHASFTLVNRAAGAEQPSQLRMVSGVLKHRIEAMKVDLKNLLRGAYKKAGFKNANS